MSDCNCFQHSKLRLLLNQNDVNVLADRAFTGEDGCLVPDENNSNIQMANRARQECTYQELHAQSSYTNSKWRHKKRLHSESMLLACELYNFRKRI